ncbi:MAG: hypothetical protein KJO38_06125 [Gammaproteobacteria bacterium]|nr:hypothetical protein [Gammaproteobacteria bacterium]
MQKSRNLVARACALTAAAALLTGCATVTPEQFSALEAKANNALSEARTAAGAANNALNVASEAAEAARQAQSTADAALSCCNENSDKIERMFEQAMRK